MTPAHRLACCLALALSLPLAAGAQPAPTDGATDALYQQGVELRARHEDSAALAVFQRLYDQTHEVRALGQLGLAEGAVGRWTDADRHLAEALQSAADPFVARNRAALDQALTIARSHLGYLVVTADAPGAQVWIDNRLSGEATESHSHRVSSGTVTFEVRAEGRTTVTRIATVPPNGRSRENVTLPPAPHLAQIDRTLPPAQPAPTAALPAGTSATDLSPRPSSTLRTVGLVGLVAGGALAVGGVVLWAVGRSAVTAFNDDPSCPSIHAPSQPTACQQHIDTARTLEPLAWTGIGLGGALAAGGLALLLTHPSQPNTPTHALRCGHGPGTVGLACALAF